MIELKPKEGELKAVIHVTRKDSGKVETYEVTGKVNHEELQALINKQSEETK